MDREIEKLMELTGMDRMQAYYHVRARRSLARSGYSGNSNLMK